MGFKIKVRDFVALDGAGNVIVAPHVVNVLNAKGFPVKAQYRLGRIGRRLLDEAKLYGDLRRALFEELGKGVSDVPGVVSVIPEEYQELYGRKNEELLDHDAEIELEPLKFADLGENFTGTSPADLVACESFIQPE